MTAADTATAVSDTARGIKTRPSVFQIYINFIINTRTTLYKVEIKATPGSFKEHIIL